MNTQDIPALIKQAQTGDTDSFILLYSAVYRPVYRIARMAMKNEDAAVEAVRLAVLDSYASLASAKISTASQFIEWLVKILCTKIRHLNKTSNIIKDEDGEDIQIRKALNKLPDI